MSTTFTTSPTARADSVAVSPGSASTKYVLKMAPQIGGSYDDKGFPFGMDAAASRYQALYLWEELQPTYNLIQEFYSSDSDGDEGDAALEPVVALAAREALLDEDHLVEDRRELLVRERERPQPEVARGVGDGAEDELDGVDDLVHHHLAKVELIGVVLAVLVG